MGDTTDKKLAAQLAEAKRELLRKEKKLKKYSQVLGAKKHVRDTLKRHNIASESECNPSSDLVNGNETQTELKCSMSRTVTFSDESPKVIILSPVRSLVSKRKDKPHKYRSLSTRKTHSREREKAVIETLSEVSQREMLRKEVESRRIFSDSSGTFKCSDSPEVGSTVSGVRTSARNYSDSFKDSEIGSLSDINIHNNDISVLKQNVPVSDNIGTIVSESMIDNDIETKILGKDYGIAVGSPTRFSNNNRESYPSSSSVSYEATSPEDDIETHEDTHYCQPHTPNDSIINWIEDASDKLQSGGDTSASKHFCNGIKRIEASETCTTATSTPVPQRKSGLEYEISDSRNELESQDLFGTQTEDTEIKRNCISPRKRWKYKTSQSSCSEGSGCGTNDKEELCKRTSESIGQNIIQGIYRNVPLEHLEVQKVLSNGEHFHEELMIKEMEQEMIKEFNTESSQPEDAKGSATSKDTMVKVDNESKQITKMNSSIRCPEMVDRLIPRIRQNKKLMTVVGEDNDIEQLDILLTQKSHEAQCKHENSVDNGTRGKYVLDEEFCKNDKISSKKILWNKKMYHVSKECEEKLRDGITLEDKLKSEMIIDFGFEKVVKSDETGESTCKSERTMHTVNVNGIEDSVNSDSKKCKMQNNSVEKDVMFHSLVASEGQGKILTTSLASLFHANEESLYILVVSEFGFTLWDTVKERNYSVKSGSQVDNMECGLNGKQCTAKGSSKKDIWKTVGEISHHVGRTSDIRDIVAVGLPSDEEARYLVAVSTTVETDVQMFYVQFNVKDKWLVIESRLGLSSCNTFKNLAACAVGEWSVAIYWTPVEHLTDGYFLITDLDVTYSRRCKQWELQCRSSFRSPVWDEPLGCLVALHQPDPRGVVLYTSSNKLYIYDAIDDIILHQFQWEVPAPSWAVTNEDLVFLLSMDTSTGQTCLSALNPLNGLQEMFFTTVFQDNIRVCDSNTEETLKVCCTSRPTCASLLLKELVVAFDSGAVIHISTDAFTCENRL